jgi:hypothetical protein
MGPLFPEPEHGRPVRLVTPMVEVLKSSLDASAVRARSVVNRWYAAWGDDATLRGHLLSRDDGQFSGALYELYLRALFVDHGYDVETHPKVTGSRNRPDFLLTKGETSFYVEATTVGLADEKKKEERRLLTLLDGFMEVSHPRFVIQVGVRTVGPSNPPRAPLVSRVRRWLDRLDADDVRGKWRDLDPEVWIWERDGWALEIQPHPVSEPAGYLLGGYHPVGAVFVTDHADLKSSLEAKSKKYGTLDLPYVIAVLERTLFGGVDEHRTDALYGQQAIRVSLESHDTEGFRRGDGFWRRTTSYQNGHVSAVLLSHGLRAWMQPLPLPGLWLHPAPDHSFDPSWLPLRTCRVVGDDVKVDDGPTEWALTYH